MKNNRKYTLLVNNQPKEAHADVDTCELKSLILSMIIFYSVFALGVYLRVNGRLW